MKLRAKTATTGAQCNVADTQGQAPRSTANRSGAPPDAGTVSRTPAGPGHGGAPEREAGATNSRARGLHHGETWQADHSPVREQLAARGATSIRVERRCGGHLPDSMPGRAEQENRAQAEHLKRSHTAQSKESERNSQCCERYGCGYLARCVQG